MILCFFVHVSTSFLSSSTVRRISVEGLSMKRTAIAASCVARGLLRRHSSCGVLQQQHQVRCFYSGLCEKKVRRLKDSSHSITKPQGRNSWSDTFMSKIKIVPYSNVSDIYKHLPANSIVVDYVDATNFTGVAQLQLPSYNPLIYDQKGGLFEKGNYPKNVRRDIRMEADTEIVELSNNRQLVFCRDPDLTPKWMAQMEASVEMITAYRNVLYDLYDSKATLLRIPAVSIENAGQHDEEIAKLTQMNVLKGFHRVHERVKDYVVMNEELVIEIYVPQKRLGEFEQAFLEEPWPIPDTYEQLANRQTLYPGLPMPKKLLENEGYVGKRQEILDAPETNGESLLSQTGLDGVSVRPVDAISDIHFGLIEHETEIRIAAERETAKAAGLVPPPQPKITYRPPDAFNESLGLPPLERPYGDQEEETAASIMEAASRPLALDEPTPIEVTPLESSSTHDDTPSSRSGI